MTKNLNVAKAFLDHLAIKGSNLISTGEKLFSYNTCIAQWFRGRLIINRTRYSNTTSKHLYYIKHFVGESYEYSNYDIVNVYEVPENTQNLAPFTTIH